jgi:HEAT repeat protein
VSVPAAFVDELAEVGLAVESPWDLVNSRRSYRAAIPVLLDWLERADAEVPPRERAKFREALVRGLAVKEARGVAAPVLLREFRRADASFDYRWAVGNALEVVADDAVFDDVVELARDPSFGRDRQMVVLALARMKNPQAVEVLTELLDDDAVAGHAVIALGRLKAAQARPAIERFLEHPQPWVRKEAKKALGKLGA